MVKRHQKRYTRVGIQCQCGAPFWNRRHILVDLFLRLLVRGA